MSALSPPVAPSSTVAPAAPPRKLLRVGAATVVGSTIEAFDFLAYGTATALVFNKLFFPNFDPAVATLAAFGTFASGMLARPLGGTGARGRWLRADPAKAF